MATAPDLDKHAGTQLRSAITPMLARSVDDLPSGKPGEWSYEPKLDGFRGLASVNTDRGVHLPSRRGARFNEVFPEIVWGILEHLPPRTVLDGEIVRWEDGRLDGAGRRPAVCRRCSALNTAGSTSTRSAREAGQRADTATGSRNEPRTGWR